MPGRGFQLGPGGEVPVEGGGHQRTGEVHKDASEPALALGTEQSSVPQGDHPDVRLGGAVVEVGERGLLRGGEGSATPEG